MAINTFIPSHHTILKKPHFHLVDNDLYFLISKRPFLKLSETEASLWSALEEQTSFAVLEGQFKEQAQVTIKKFVELGICHVVNASFPDFRRRVLVIEPHSDDAALSVGGVMWLWQNTHEFTVATIASKSNFTSYYTIDRDFFDVNRISALRGAEGQLFASLVGGKYRAANLPDAVLRYRDSNWSLEWFRRNRLSVLLSVSRSYEENQLFDWAQSIRKLIEDMNPEEIWMPMGIGTHCDHQLTRDACLKLFAEHPLWIKEKTIRMYQDVPYLARQPDHAQYLVETLKKAGCLLSPEVVPINEVYDQKIMLNSVYGSQFKKEALAPGIEISARLSSTSHQYAETLWQMDRMPERLDFRELSPHYWFIKKEGIDLSGWYKSHSDEARIRILLLVPTGNWVKDAQVLLRAFPHAVFDIYASTAAATEVGEYRSERMRLYPMKEGIKSWLSLAFKLMLSRPLTTLFIAGEKRLKVARLMSKFWPGTDSLTLYSIDPLLTTLQYEKSNGS